jgi:hypothetical protein
MTPQFEGIENFRDFGGYPTVCGRGLKRGVLYRSANHAYATDADLQALRDLGVGGVSRPAAGPTSTPMWWRTTTRWSTRTGR